MQDSVSLAETIETIGKAGEKVLREHPNYEVDILRNTVKAMRAVAADIIAKNRAAATIKAAYFENALEFIEAQAPGQIIKAHALDEIYSMMPHTLESQVVLCVIKSKDLKKDEGE